MSASTIDYDSLAAQHGGTAMVDYDALAAQHGGSASEATISAVHEPTTLAGKVGQWAQDFTGDLKHGTGNTAPGRLLQKMGAPGLDTGVSEATGDFMGSAPLGVTRMVQGGAELAQSGKRWQGAKDIAGGALQAATIPSAFVAPEVAENASGVPGAIESAARTLLPSGKKQAAGELFQSIAKDANKVPVELEKSQDAALKLMDWQKKTQLGPTLNKFLNRVTSGSQGPLTYEEGRDFYSLLSRMSADEASKLAPPVKFYVKQLTAGLKEDIGTSAGQVGRAADYYKAMGDYAKAAKLQDWLDSAKKAAIGGLKYGIGPGAAGYLVKKGIDAATDNQ